MAYTDAHLSRFLRKCRAANRGKEPAPIGASEPNLKCTPKTLSAEQMERVDAVIQQQRIECEKGGWRASAKWLEENCEECREPKAAPMPRNEMASSDICPNSEVANEPQPLANAPESPQSAPTALPAPLPMEPLPSSFWWALLFGNPDSSVSSSDATRALQLVSAKFGVPIADGETIETVRAGQLRKLLRGRFGLAAEQTMSALWRSAPASPGTPQPDIGQSQLPAGALPVSHSQPQWIAELNEPGGSERQWLMDNGFWCG